jgi:hypothetical protein
MRYRRRTHIPMFQCGEPIGYLIWKDNAMEARTADGNLVGRYATRREAAAALWATRRRQRDVRGRWLHNSDTAMTDTIPPTDRKT